jgi:nitrogenase molybdenum-iron protein alpha/beta subunit
MTEKGMHPYTEKEYKSQKDETHEQLKGATKSIWDHFMSINTVIAAMKKFPEAFKYRMEQNEKFEAGKLYQQLVETLLPSTNLFNLNDIKADADSELDTSIMQVIE